MFQFSQRSIGRMKGVHPDLIKVANRALSLTKIDFGIPEHGGLRTELEQRQLFLDGKSNADGYEEPSYHQTGEALDFYAIDPETKEASWKPELLFHIACAFFQAADQLNISIEWGGLFRSWSYPGDAGHVQLRRA